MNIHLKIFLLIVIAVFTVIIATLLKKGKLKVKYSMLWLLMSLVLLFAFLFPKLISKISGFCGFDLPVNFIFFVAVFFILTIMISLCVVVSKQAEKIKQLIQQMGILEKKLRKLEDTDGISE